MTGQIFQQGQINTNALQVPNLIVQIVPPSFTLLNGVPTNVVGFVGTAVWGPVNSPVDASGIADAARLFGPMQPRKHDLTTAVYAAALQGGAASMKLVRVTDGTDVAASAPVRQAGASSAAVVAGGSGYAVGNTITVTGGAVLTVASVTAGAVTGVTVTTPGTYAAPPTGPVAQTATSGSGTGATFNLTFATGLTLTALYTGTLGNSLTFAVSAGSNSTVAAPTYRLTLALPNQVPEVFDNIGGSGGALYQNMADAINKGQSGLRGPSQLVVATAGAATGAPMLAGGTLSGGTDGTGTINSATLVGVDTVPRKGMYALRNTNVSVAMLADADDSSQWSVQQAFGLSEGVYMLGVSPAGDTISNFAASIATAGIDSYAMKVIFGDWCYIFDAVNNQTRLISPQGFIAGLLGNLTPSGSTLNKPLSGIIGTQKTQANQQYSQAELQSLAQARGDLITNPAPGGSYFAARFGRNTSSNAVVRGDNYTRMTNFIAATLNAGMGIYVGRKISPTLFNQAFATLDAFLTNLKQQDEIAAHEVKLDATNNPFSRTALGYLQADVKVQYQAINEYFIINLEGGQSVKIDRIETNAAQ
ncbi:hypothetical protein R5W24_000482 [Gemmata sp. JC717]|uniref:hypothetical protein n=1 Tax=Gemmata algarum TaxID=2975278 RepID=UPI0021BB77FA|nr:hypothetical protein [Gemmata algarum]MDY3551406.1 hypothetical protein [Gemmata algarum]